MEKKQDYNIHFELLKTIAEHNKERMFEYNVAENRAVLFAVVNGEFVENIVYDNYIDDIDNHLAELSDEHRQLYKKALKKCIQKSCHQIVDIKMKTNSKHEWFRLFLASFAEDLDEPDKITKVAGRFMSIQDQKDIEESIRRKAEIDSLTGVYNHATFENLCEKILKEEKSDIMLLMIDVDDFKMINDTLGHNVGDMVLSQTGEILKQTVGSRGYAGRLGGDEFAIIVWGFSEREDINVFCQILINNLKNIIFDMEYSASMGIAIRNGRSIEFKDLYYEADQAVYSAKKNGKNQLIFYDDVLKDKDNAKDEISDEIDFDNSGIAEYDKAVMNNNPEYIIVTNLAERKILFMNRAAKSASIMDDYTLKKFMKMPIDDDCIEIKDNRRDFGDTYFSSNASERGKSFIAQIFGNCNLLVHIEFGMLNDKKIERVSLINLSDKAHLNHVYRSKEKSQKAINDLFNYVTRGYATDTEYNLCTKTLLSYYGADCALIVYVDEHDKPHLVQSYKESAQMTAKILAQSARTGGINDFLVLYNQEGSALVDDIKVLKNSQPTLYKKLADSRVWSFAGSIIRNEEQINGAVIVLNPRENSCDRNIIEMISSFIESHITIKKMENIYQYEETHDKITGLLKRDQFKMWDLGKAESKLKSLGIFVTDIINMKNINNSFGYATGNSHLRTVADILQSVFAGCYVYRFDGDDFIAFCPDISQEDFEKRVDKMKTELDTLDFAVAGGFSWSEKVNVSRQLLEAEEVLSIDKDNLRQKNVPLYKQAKKVIADVEKELNSGHFTVYLQPKVNMNNGKTVGAEALVRLYSEEFGIISPLKFIPVLEENNAVHMIDLFVLEQVCKFQKEKIEAGEQIVPISVNFSKKTLINPNLLEAVDEIMQRYNTPKGIIQIEITESVSDMDHLIISNIANSLRNMGFELAMDDFGTKYANMETLINFQFGIAKVDRSLVKDIATNEKSVIMLKHLTAMLNELEISCVIEGVETQEQIDILKGMNCDIIQGFFYGKPTPSEDFYKYFMKE